MKLNSIWLVRHKKWGYCVLFPDKVNVLPRGLWYGSLHPMQAGNYGKYIGSEIWKRQYVPHIKVMKITKSTSHRAAKLIINQRSKNINLSRFC